MTTPGALDACTAAGVDLADLFARHHRGDWGDLDAHDRAVNERALRDGSQLLSAYVLPTGPTVYIVTDSERQTTTSCLSHEY